MCTVLGFFSIFSVSDESATISGPAVAAKCFKNMNISDLKFVVFSCPLKIRYCCLF